VLDQARKGGATAAETEVSQGVGQSVTVRKGDVETIAYNRDKGISVTVTRAAPRHASSADFADASIRDTVAKALAIARFTAEDPSAGLADADRLAKRWGDLDLYHPWDLSVDEAIALGRDARPRRCASTSASPTRTARRCRAARASSCTRTRWASAAATGARAIDRRLGDRRGRRGMQRDYWYSAARAPGDLARGATSAASPASARCAASARAARDDRMPGAVRGAEAVDLIGAFVQAVSGGSLTASRASSSTRSARRSSRRTSRSARSRTSARARQRAVRRGRRRDRAARRRRPRRRQRLFPRQLRRAQAGHALDRQRGRQPQPRRLAR
jgi:PmbA protein